MAADSSRILIQQASGRMAVALATLDTAAFAGMETGWSPDEVRKFMRKARNIIRVAAIGPAIVGAIYTAADNKTIEVCRIVVAPAARRRGVAKALLEDAISRPQDPEVDVWACVPDDSRYLPAHCLLRSVGLKAVGVADDVIFFSRDFRDAEQKAADNSLWSSSKRQGHDG